MYIDMFLTFNLNNQTKNTHTNKFQIQYEL